MTKCLNIQSIENGYEAQSYIIIGQRDNSRKLENVLIDVLLVIFNRFGPSITQSPDKWELFTDGCQKRCQKPEGGRDRVGVGQTSKGKHMPQKISMMMRESV